MPERPNFILFVTDQQRADFLGCYGHPVLKTPNIDSLAENGMAFDRFYVASPVCMPNRASLMTCRMPSSHGVRCNGIPLDTCNVTFVELLRDLGYDTALIGKSHLLHFTGKPPLVETPKTRPGYLRASDDLREARKSDLAADKYVSESPEFWLEENAAVPTPFYGFDHVELVTGHGDGVGGDYRRWLKTNAPHVLDQIGVNNQLPHDYCCPQAVRTAVPEEFYSTRYIANRASAWLAGRPSSEKPFFLMVSWPDPHHPFNPPGKYWDMYRPEDMKLPAAFSRSGWEAPVHVLAAERTRSEGNAALDGMSTVACSAREAQEARALTCGMIAMIDEALGQVLKTARSESQLDGTVVAFTSDHGDHLGDHRLLFKGAEQYEQITRVPFIWCDPDGERGTRASGIGQTIDIGATILERAKIEPASGMQGLPLPVVSGEGRDIAFIQYDTQRIDPAFGPQPRVHTARDSKWRLSVYHDSRFGELYDMENDPEELDNLWDVKAYSATKARMMEKLVRLELDAVDRMPLPISQA